MSIIIIGCGMAGPVLAMLLKHKGFDPVIYERVPEILPAGISLSVSPQTFKVLDILGLAHELMDIGVELDQVQTYSQLLEKEIGTIDGPQKVKKMLGWPMSTVSRSKYHRLLVDSARARGIPIHLGKKLMDVRDNGEKVTAVFEDGTTAQGDLLIGADGLHSNVRNALFGAEEATYMGIAQIGGMAPIPEFFKKTGKNTLYQAFGDGAHFLCMPISASEMAWANTLYEPFEAREDWRRVGKEGAEEILKGLPAASWDHGPKDVIAGATFVTKYGLYERPILPVWHKGRVALVGDAAHPTSPHLGQGANQAMEDCYHLVRLLVKSPQPFTTESLEAAFVEYERIRLPIVQLAVGQAKKDGEGRVLKGHEACVKRDEGMMKADGYGAERMKVQLQLLQGPFQGQSEI